MIQFVHLNALKFTYWLKKSIILLGETFKTGVYRKTHLQVNLHCTIAVFHALGLFKIIT